MLTVTRLRTVLVLACSTLCSLSRASAHRPLPSRRRAPYPCLSRYPVHPLPPLTPPPPPSLPSLQIERTDIHPDFNFATFACDFAVITVANPPTDEEYERAGIVYARLNFNPAWPSLGKTVTLTGWGSVDGGSLVASPVLRVTSFRRDRFRTCANYLEDNNLPVVGLNVKTMICFSLADNTASCGGDSGAPVWRFFEKPGFRSYWRIYGVVSFGYQDPANATDVCPPGGPDYYARLSVAEAWFQTVL